MRILLGIFVLLLSLQANAQCDDWNGKPNQTEIMEWHTIYRGAMKAKDYKFAEKNWVKVFEIAPNADGKRETHYKDGIKIFKAKMKGTKDAALKAEYGAKILSIYDQLISCYESKALTMKCTTDACYAARIGKWKGRKGFDMYFNLDKPVAESHPILEESLNTAAKSVEYIIFSPLAYGTVALYEEGVLDADKARTIYEKMMVAVDMKIAAKGKYVDKYVEGKEAIEKAYKPIERDLFDCAFFVKKLKPEYEADPENPEVIKLTLALLKAQGCEEGEPFFDEISEKWTTYATEKNAELQAEFEANNPSIIAKKLYDEGKFQEAIDKYNEAIAEQDDVEKKASYLFSIASIQFRKLDQYSTARKTALEAASLRPDWGRPYLLIGDMYAKTSRNCGKDWDQRLAVLAAIDKYNKAKSVDPETADEANKKIGIYYSSKPTQDEGFMRGKKPGDRLKVDCWIGETVTLSYQ